MAKPTIRRFEAAKFQRTLADWIQSQMDTFDTELKNDLPTLRARSRDASINDPYARRYFKSITTNVIGPDGIRLKMAVRNGTGKPDTLANILIEERWERFSRNVTTDGQNMREALKLFLETVARDGEVFVVIRRGEQFGPYMMQLQFFESEYVDVKYDGRAKNGNRIVAGIERDEYSKPVAYYFFKHHPQSHGQYNAERIRIPAKDVIHGYSRERVMQGRGYPWLSAGLIALTHLKEYQKSELIAARIASAKMGFFTRPPGENELGDEEDPNDENALRQEVEAGVFDILPSGYSLQTFDPQNPTANFGNFVKIILRSVAASVGVSYHTLANDLESTSYSSLRQGALDERETFKELQMLLIERFLTPVFEEWLNLVLAFRLDNIRLPLELYDKFNTPHWRPRTWQWIDPQKETNAIKAQLDYKLRSRTDVARALGMDYMDVLNEIAAENANAENVGVQLNPEAPPEEQPEQPQEDEDNE